MIREFSVCWVKVLSLVADGLNAALFDQHFSLLVHLFQYAVDSSVPRRWKSLGWRWRELGWDGELRRCLIEAEKILPSIGESYFWKWDSGGSCLTDCCCWWVSGKVRWGIGNGTTLAAICNLVWAWDDCGFACCNWVVNPLCSWPSLVGGFLLCKAGYKSADALNDERLDGMSGGII